MIVHSYQRHGLSFAVVWLYNGADPLPKADIIELVQNTKPLAGATEFLSLTTDLTLPEEELMRGIDKQCRYEIRRAEREGVTFQEFGLKLPVTDAVLNEYAAFYDAFAESKGLQPCDRAELKEMAGEGILILTKADYQERPLVYHSYAAGAKQCRLLHSASLYRNEQLENKNIVSMANRFLHYQDMLAFRAQGYCSMDWGGVNYTDPNLLNITKFKKQFGGSDTTGYNICLAETWKGKCFRALTARKGRRERDA